MEFKAGMESVDFDQINSMLNQFSMGTHFQAKIERETQQTNEYIEEILQKLEHLPTDDVYHKVVDDYLDSLLKCKDTSRTFIHVDMDAFYASVEEMDNHTLKGLPVAVGSMDMLVTSNYKAREYGVRSGIPGMVGLRLCPNLEIVPIRMDRYKEVSQIIRDIFFEFDPNYVSPSLDEGCLDITIYLKDHPELTPVDVASQLQYKIYKATTLTSSMGIACSPLLSKLSSEVNKPNGYFCLTNSHEESFKYLQTIPIKKIPGIGRVRQKLLETLGLQSVEDILESKYELYFILPDKHKEILFKHALGVPIFPTPNLFKVQRKKTMISKEKNCKELYDEKDLKSLMLDIYNFAINTLKQENKIACGMIVKVQDYSFKVQNFPYSLKKDNSEVPQLDIDGYVILSPPTQSPPLSPISSSSNITTTTTISPQNKKKSTKIVLNYKENIEKIWELFEETVKTIKFEQIRCLGLKLVNLIDDNDSLSSPQKQNGELEKEIQTEIHEDSDDEEYIF
ncbi:UMUC-like DNA-repair protein [Tieghemostelium lacteum]|uniref:DNA polymerase kappa n=1 Tax=Tieghemostelium lacteum TaxID=361077 RepID=A0A152A9G4_TIELA|nr:UMUC-like DNA-repair protein [Tieghemostelium lacteum]|eukprot:KYR02854.1 UMUC-like DNA-repair protein [Tieghemostelium lacteum]